MHLVYRTTNSVDKYGTIEHANACKCFRRSHFFALKKRFEYHVKHCAGIPGILHKL